MSSPRVETEDDAGDMRDDRRFTEEILQSIVERS
jgi:hypothetical protein